MNTTDNNEQPESAAAVRSSDLLEPLPPHSLQDIERWLDAEISMGRLIHNMSLETCYAQAADLIGGMANTYGEMMRKTMARFDEMREDAKRHYAEARERGNEKDMLAEAARMRAFTEAMSDMRFCCGRENNRL